MGSSSSKSGVVTWGSAEYGQLGVNQQHSGLNLKSPQLIESLSSKHTIKSIACGGHHSAAIRAEKGEIFTWGCNSSGQLGLNSLDHQYQPTLVKELINLPVRQVSCGDQHTAACLQNGLVYTWGNAGHGRLGIGSLEIFDNSFITQPTLVEKLQDHFIVQVSCGSFHTAFLASYPESVIFTCGLGACGRLGHGNELDAEEPLPVAIPQTGHIKQVSCGGHHSACVTSNGTLCIWGGGTYGKLGLGTTDQALRAEIVKGPLKNTVVVAVSLGSQHSGCITSNGEVYTWGQGGKLGHTAIGEADCLVPRKLTALTGIFIKSLSCGHCHNAALDEAGSLWSWGSNYELTHGSTKFPANEPHQLEAFSNKIMSQVMCGKNHTIALIVSDDTPPMTVAGSASDIAKNVNPVNFDAISDYNENDSSCYTLSLSVSPTDLDKYDSKIKLAAAKIGDDDIGSLLNKYSDTEMAKQLVVVSELYKKSEQHIEKLLFENNQLKKKINWFEQKAPQLLEIAVNKLVAENVQENSHSQSDKQNLYDYVASEIYKSMHTQSYDVSTHTLISEPNSNISHMHQSSVSRESSASHIPMHIESASSISNSLEPSL